MPLVTSVWFQPCVEYPPGTSLGATGAVMLDQTSLREAAPARRFRGNGRKSSVLGSLSGSKVLTCLVALYEGNLRGEQATYSRVGALHQRLVVLSFAVGDKNLHIIAGIM